VGSERRPAAAPKMFSCEAVLSQVHFLTQDIPKAKNRIEGWLADGWLELPFRVREHHSLVHELMARYANVPARPSASLPIPLRPLGPSPTPVSSACPNSGPTPRSSPSTPTSASIAATNASHSL